MPELPMVGTDFAGYRIHSVIGRGGSSTVYQADHLRLGSVVALKVLAPELAAHDRFRTRFLEESRIAASLNHPNVIPIFDMGPAGGLLYIAMRCVVGTDMRKLLSKPGEPLPPAESVFLVGQAARALDAAHRRGLVHRDVKPGNLLIERGEDDDPDHVYLSDFGITKYSASRSGLTPAGQFLGSIDYIAPEQIQALPVDGRADQYSLGCVLYECLTGYVPFQKELDAAIIWAHVEEAPPMPSTLRPELPADLDDVFARVLAKEPGDRYPTCRAFVDAARGALGLPVTAPRLVTRPQAEVPPSQATYPPQEVIRPAPAAASPAAGLAAGSGLQADPRTGPAGSFAAAGPGPEGSGERFFPPGDPLWQQHADRTSGPQAFPVPLSRPPSRRSHRGRWIAALAVALILIAGAIGGIFLAAHGSGTRHPAGAMSMGHAKHKGSAASTGSAMPMAHKPGTLDKALILANQSGGAAGLLPPSSCRQHNADLVICTNPHPAIDEAQFRTFPTLTALYSAYVTQVKGLSHGRFRANFQNCRQTATQGEVSWNHMYQHPRNYSVAQMESGKITDSQAVGRVFCTFTSGEEFFVWTQNNGHFLGEVVGAPHVDVWNWWVGIHHNIALGGETMKGMHMP